MHPGNDWPPGVDCTGGSQGVAVEPYLVAGLGNPGPRYATNRHNVGFRCLELLAARHELAFDKRQKRAVITSGAIRTRRIILAKPQTFMNESGRAVVPLARFYKVQPERLMVVYDDLDLPLGTIRLRPEGGSGGHKGMRSIIEQIGTPPLAYWYRASSWTDGPGGLRVAGLFHRGGVAVGGDVGARCGRYRGMAV